ncbi:SIMPL domain-containing protein [Dechloromonas sp. XY25]|uniref:SIMPL domain-containing protein n=1 Tax=Dechloromonas hankyongensis TaxID=2908002 RepID=A0ABS9K4B1_9RHOO|nr:SIMPL domain-containing protein [Dechloromonas hankyongensis]MCG2578009.1 SIMPL domain-containing protein [Dechloromonas hankyongensis]
MKKTLLSLLAAGLAASAQAGALVDLSAEASRPAANDMVRASVYSEASGSNPADLARQVNGNIAEALRIIREKKGVTVKTGSQSTYPIYTQSRKIDGWRMRSEVLIESKDFGAVSELLGRLQQMRLAVGDISQMPAPETRRQAEDEAMREAIRAFQNRAAVVGEQLGKTWQIKQMHINQGGGTPVPLLRGARAAMMAAEAAPAPIEAGESTITTNVSGQIELAD